MVPRNHSGLTRKKLAGYAPGYSIMTDNLKRAGIFRKSAYIFLWCPFSTFTFRILGVFVDEF